MLAKRGHFTRGGVVRLQPEQILLSAGHSFNLGRTEAALQVSCPDIAEKHPLLAKIIVADPAVRVFPHAVGATGSHTKMRRLVRCESFT